jgi:DNA-directed RNA polymerase specialized sigma24 family protein
MAQLERLIIRQIPSLRAYARLLVGERIRADDLVQDCLERAWSRAHLFRADGEHSKTARELQAQQRLNALLFERYRRAREEPIPPARGAPAGFASHAFSARAK